MLPITLMKLTLIIAIITFAAVLVRWLIKSELWSGRAHKAIIFFFFPSLLLLFTALSLYADDRRISFAVLIGFMIFWALDSYAWSVSKKALYEHAVNVRRAKKLIQELKLPKNG